MSELVWQFKASKYSYGSIYLKWRVITKWKIKKKEEMNKEELQKQLEKRLKMKINYISSFQLLSHVWLFATPWITAHQASLSITNSWSSPKPMTMPRFQLQNSCLQLSIGAFLQSLMYLQVFLPHLNLPGARLSSWLLAKRHLLKYSSAEIVPWVLFPICPVSCH